MGQYYIPTLIDEDGSIRMLNAHAYGNGLKLMEHSYIGNNFVNAVLTLLWNNPQRVAWIGDYSDSKDGDAYEKKLTHEDFLHFYEAAWGEGDKDLLTKPEPEPILTNTSRQRYIVNHTQRCYIDVVEFIIANHWTESGAWVNGRYDASATSTWCLNPLPLLTACGNGRGGGDYHANHPGFADVGTWAFDLIEVTDVCPHGYQKVAYHFSEQQTTA